MILKGKVVNCKIVCLSQVLSFRYKFFSSSDFAKVMKLLRLFLEVGKIGSRLYK